MSKRAYTFPGQGSQAVGMGKDLAEAYSEARAVFEEVDEALGQDLSTIMFEGPEDVLRLTENAQPALMAVSVAIVRVLEAKGVRLADHAAYVAGHSLGEYSALCAAGTFSLADTARLLKTRGQAMQKAVPVGHGAMAALLGLDLEAARQVAAEAGQGEVCDVANDNAPGQVVISGATAAIERAVDIAKGKGAKRALLLPVSAPFHCALMQPAAEAMAQALAEVSMHTPAVPLVANVLSQPISDPTEIRQRLVEQVTGMVRWTESISWLTGQGSVTHLSELGTGKVLTGLAKRINPEATANAVGTSADIDAFVAELSA
ncbi:MAG TPA: ACP S-malonyltransferase [Devosia sp.]